MGLYRRAMVLLLIFCAFMMCYIPARAEIPEDWYAVKGTYARDNNSQYNNGTLSLMYLDNDVVMFEFFMMEGSESEDTSNNFCLSGAFYLDEAGTGIYEHPKTGDVKLTFTLSEKGVIVNQTGKLPIDVSGKYSFIESYIKVTEQAAVEILEQLPTAATSLNHNNGEYKISMSDEMVDGWFYDVKANFIDTKALLAEFYIASDMSAVYRVDTEEPILVWGSAQPMLDAAYSADVASLFGVTEDENSSKANDTEKVQTSAKMNYVSIYPQNTSIAIGDSTQIVLSAPGKLKYSLTYKSSDPEITRVDEKGVITGVAEGEAVITGSVTIDGAEKPFEVSVFCFNGKEAINDTLPISESNNFLWILIPAIIMILLALYILVRKISKKHPVKLS